MIELLDTFPDVSVPPAEYKRLLGLPRDRVLEGRVRELADWARDWYAANGKPWTFARQVRSLELTNGLICIDAESFSSAKLANALVGSGAESAVLVAVSAGPELELEAQELWRDEKPDEYFFLEMFGSAVVEHLVTMTGARLCSWADREGLAVLPHYSPGYPEWDVSQQPRLLELMKTSAGHALMQNLDALESGMLRPKKSLLAVFPLTRQVERVRRLSDLVPCESCSFNPCQFRRAPYSRGSTRIEESPAGESTQTVSALDSNPRYSTSVKALKRWADERLTLTHNDDGSIDALFVYDGTTCTNMGREFKFHYRVKLAPREKGYRMLKQHCEPAPGDVGHRFMCRYMNNAEHLMVAIEREQPLLNRPLNDVLTWRRNTCSAGCHCEPAARAHKWGLILETIHYALVQFEKKRHEEVIAGSDQRSAAAR